MDTTPVGRIRYWLDSQQITPVAAGLALGGGFLTWLFFEGALLQPFGESNNLEAEAAALGFLGVLKVLLIAAPVVALWRPWLAIGLAVPMAIWVVFTSANVPMGLYVGLLAVAMVSVFRNSRAAIVALLLALVPIAVVCAALRPMAVPYGSVIDQQYADLRTNVILFGVYALVSSCLVGAAFLLRSRASARQEQTALQASRQELAREAAVTEERARLARDLHDVVAHHVSLIAVRAETAPFQHPALSAEAKSVLAEIGADARAAMEELREVLGVLRRSEGDADTAPQPGVGDIPALVERARESGQQVELDGELPDLRPSHGYALFRVIQEALTNARRHASDQTVSIHLRGGGVEDVEVSVLNRIAGADNAVGEGRGLAGMRERVEALGGDLTAARIGEDFVVHVRLPHEVTADSGS